MADHHAPALTPAQHRAYFLTRAHLTAVELSVDLELARQDGASSQELADRLNISVATLEALEEAWNGG
jgi:DNA-binding CsgD family transcriptional regulator